MSEQFSLELQLVLALSHPDGLQVDKAKALCNTAINWPRFIAICHRQHVSGFIHARLAKYPDLPLPQNVLQAFSAYASKTTARNLFMLGAFEQLSAAFAQEKIQMVAFKGIDYIDRIYTSIDQRFLSDLDLLIHQKDLIATRALLESMGYNCIENIRQSRFHEKRFGYIHAPLQCQKGGVSIDLHIRLGKEHMRINEQVWQEIEPKQRHFVMKPAFALLYHCYHLNKHVYGHGFKLSQLLEFVSLFNKCSEIEKQQVWKLVNKISATQWLVNSNALLQYFYQNEIALQFDDQQKHPQIEHNILNWIEKEEVAKNLETLKSLNPLEWLAFGLFQVFPTKNYLNQWHANGQKQNSYLKLWLIRAVKMVNKIYTRFTKRA
jgi:hypothetical protein